MRIPYRHHLNGTLDPATGKLLSRISTANAPVADVLNDPAFIETANEIVLWQVIQRLCGRSAAPADRLGVRYRALIASRILARALRDADAEGVAWTPLLDVLEDSGLWKLVQDQAKALGRTFPTPRERAMLLAAWAAQTREPDRLEDSLDFQSEVVHMAVARNAGVMSPEIISRLRVGPRTMKQALRNPRLDSDGRRMLVECAYGAWKAAFLQEGRLGALPFNLLGKAEADGLAVLLENGLTLSASLRADAFRIAQNQVGGQQQDAIRFLVSDRSTPAEMLEHLAPYADPQNAARILAHSRCPDALWDKLGKNTCALRALLSHYQLPADKVIKAHVAVRRHPGWLDLRCAILRQLHGSSDIWLAEIAESDWQTHQILTALSSNPRARQHPKVRAALLNRNSVGIARNLLRDVRPDEFERIMRLLVNRAPNVAYAALEEVRLPSGTPFPEKLVNELLVSKKSERRLLGIAILGNFGSSGQAATASDEGHEPPRRSINR